MENFGEELGYKDGDVINIAEYCSDRICRPGKGNKSALISEDHRGNVREYTFNDVRVLTNTIANYLKKLKITPGERICLFMDKVPELYFGFLGILKLGGIAQPLYSAFGSESLFTRLDDAQTSAIFTQRKHLPKVRAILKDLPSLKFVIVVDSPTPDPSPKGRGSAGSALLQEREVAFNMEVVKAFIVAGALKVLYIISRTTERRDKLEKDTAFWRKSLTAAGFIIKEGETPIVPVMLFNAKLSQDFAKDLYSEGVYAVGFFFPVVPKGQARIRTQLSAAHKMHHLEKALDAFIKVGKKYEILYKTKQEIINRYGM